VPSVCRSMTGRTFGPCGSYLTTALVYINAHSSVDQEEECVFSFLYFLFYGGFIVLISIGIVVTVFP
jgi:hypothetical protein